MNYRWANIFWNLFTKKGFDGKLALARLPSADKAIEPNFHKNRALTHNHQEFSMN